jgi:hypothetical protein
MHTGRVFSPVCYGCAVPGKIKSRIRGKAGSVGVVEDFRRRIEPNGCDVDRRFSTRMRTTHDKQMERKICDSAIPVNTSSVTLAHVSSWIPVKVIIAGWVRHIANATIACGPWGVNVFSDGPDIGTCRASGSIDQGAEDIAHCFVQSYNQKEEK